MKGLIYSEQLAMFDNREIIGYGKDDFYVQEYHVINQTNL